MKAKSTKKKPIVAAPDKGKPKRSWTIMVYMVGGPELGPALLRDLLELDRAGSSDDVSVIVSFQQSARSITRWIEILPVDEDDNPGGHKEVGRAKDGTLNEQLDQFLDHVAENYPAENHTLIFWAHASGLQFGRLGPGVSEDLIHLRELAKSLETFRKARKSTKKLDILGFCACAVSKAEFAIELRNEVSYLVSSQVGISTLMTWPFDVIVKRVLLSPTVEPERLASYMVQLFEESYEPPPVALTAVNLDKSDNLLEVVGNLANTILKALNTDVDDLNNMCILRAFRRALDAYPYDLEPVVDFIDFCVKLVEEGALDEATRTKARTILDMGPQSFIVTNARSGPKFAALNGLGIIAPDFDDPNWLKSLDLADNVAPSPLWDTGWIEMAKKVYAFSVAHPEFNA